jgi:hypothetical protein
MIRAPAGRARIDRVRALPYHGNVAERRTGGRGAGTSKKSQKLPTAVLFWLVFCIVITGFFLINRETIKRNFTILAQRFTFPAQAAPARTLEEPPAPPPAVLPAPAAPSAPPETPVARPETAPAAPVVPVTPAVPATPAVQSPSVTPPPSAAPPSPSAERSPPVTPQSPPTPQQRNNPASQAARLGETRERAIYFTRVDNDGVILRSKVSRKLTVSDSPMLDSLTALLAGPGAEEQRRGMVSLIPKNTRILAATVRGSTAYISFSEDFQYNTYGVEGYAAQLKQVVWTVTEFPNITDVQILIEGRRVDYLGEGIWIGGPLNRDSL